MPDGKGVRRMGEKGEGIKKYKLAITNSHRDIKCSIGNIVSNSIITMYGVKWVLDLSGDHLVSYINAQAL